MLANTHQHGDYWSSHLLLAQEQDDNDDGRRVGLQSNAILDCAVLRAVCGAIETKPVRTDSMKYSQEIDDFDGFEFLKISEK